MQRVDLSQWTKSSYSAVNGDCVEVKALAASAIAVRDSKNPHRPSLAFEAASWNAFVREAGANAL
ncbi:DUF397 domain-containing protein [Streptomyces sp. NPDC058247]|uniref:DUF397 domain-containing protein n=1 Tax=Streptomyces sp. NPDC058247 TaxID=3346401 RepID=UPI0036E46457